MTQADRTNQAVTGSVIAVVDDSATLCEMLCDLLNDEGYITQPYLCGEDALNGMAMTPPDLILLDIDMPGMDGYEVCAKIKSHAILSATPVLFISSYSALDDKLKAFDFGALDYVTKPIHFAEVKARIKTHLSLRYYQQALQSQNDTLEATLTALKATQQQLVQAEKLASLGQLVAGVAHEINNPISFIVGNGHALKKNVERLEKYLDCVHAHAQENEINALRETLRIDAITQELGPMVGDILESAGRVTSIVDDLSHSSAQQQAEKEPIDLKDAVSLAVKWVTTHRHPSPIIQTENVVSTPVIAHKGQLIQVMVNVLNNAMDALKGTNTPVISIESHVLDAFVWVSISDNGAGIDENKFSQLFDPFFTTKKVGEGSGLGLAISYRLITEHGGEFKAENRPEGGARFSFSIPLSTT
ncbi:response regulator [Enterovibrio sp. ZSDZ35]|uniref:histidine kinase n=1 Tax=Enterovibrio qingdaonensis TaxID=2899818 RepID=A0ABT5QI88_9GAMM|nr:response regulator [Enterovibrio sp. ZSDZ35]MDD1780695.1 response regulator [Enterovibrio sp. ZSDZ35]